MTRLAYYRRQIRQLLILWASIVVLFSAERALMFLHFVPSSIRSQPNLETAALFSKGLLFDIKVASITIALPFLLGLLSLLHPAASRLWQRFQAALLAVLFAIVAAAAIGNWFYFRCTGISLTCLCLACLTKTPAPWSKPCGRTTPLSAASSA